MTRIASRKKNVSGYGNIRARPNGTYEGSLLINGKRKYFYAKSEKEIRKKLTATIAENDRGNQINESKTKLGEWLDIWQRDYLAGVKESTRARYQLDIREYIKPQLGQIPLKTLTTAQIQAFYKRKLDDLSPKSIHNLHGVLHQALEQAVKNNMIYKNVSDGCILPRKEQVEMHPLTDENLKRFLDAIKGHPYENFYFVAVFTGMRQGELLGLSWDNVNLDRGTITVRQQLQRDRNQKKVYIMTSVKNGKSRIIQPAQSVMDVLRAEKEKQKQYMAKAGDLWNNEMNLVFTNEIGRRYATTTVFHQFKEIVRKLGLPEVRFHDLRHTYATLSLENGSDIKTVSASMGHATTAFTMDRYGHVSQAMLQDSAKRMENLISSLKHKG